MSRKMYRNVEKRGVHTARNGPSPPPTPVRGPVVKPELSTADRLGSRRGVEPGRMARVVDAVGRRASLQSFPPRSGFVQVEISGVPAAINARKTLCVGSVYNENRTDTKDLLVLDKTRYQRNAVVQPLAAQLGSSLSQQNSAPFQVSAVLREGTSRISVRSRWPSEQDQARKGPPTFWHQGTAGGPFRPSIRTIVFVQFTF